MITLDRNDWGDLYIEQDEELSRVGFGRERVIIAYEELEKFLFDVIEMAQDIRMNHVADD